MAGLMDADIRTINVSAPQYGRRTSSPYREMTLPHIDAHCSAAKAVGPLSLLVPNPIRRIYVLCGYQSQTWHDFHRRFAPPQKQYLVRWQAQVGGPSAAQDIATNMDKLPLDEGDIVVLQRGGGDAESLSAFDQPELISAIQRCPVPVFTAIGHMKDVSNADRAAAASMSTPTALGEALATVLGKQWHQRQKKNHNRRATRPTTAETPLQNRERSASSSRPATAFQHPIRTESYQRLTTPTAQPSPPVYTPPAPSRLAPVSSTEWRMAPAIPVRRANNSLGTASFVLGLSSIVFALFGATPIVGLILGIVALRRRPRALALTGVIINSIILLICIAFIGLSLVLAAHSAATSFSAGYGDVA